MSESRDSEDIEEPDEPRVQEDTTPQAPVFNEALKPSTHVQVFGDLVLEDGSVPQFDIPPPPPGLEFVPTDVMEDFGTAAVPADSSSAESLIHERIVDAAPAILRDPAAHASRELHKWIKHQDSEAIIAYYPLLPHSHEKKQAMQWALEYAKRESIGPLLHIAGIEQDPHLKAHLAKLIDHAGADSLTPKLEGRSFPVDQRRGVPLLLTRCRYGTMRDKLIALADDEDTGVRESVVRCVVHFPFHEDLHIPLLSRRVQMEKNRDVRLEAVRGLLILNRPAANIALEKALRIYPPSREILNFMTSFIAERRRTEDRRNEVERRISEIPFEGPERRKADDRRQGDRRIMTLEEAVAALREPPQEPEAVKKPVLLYGAVAAGMVIISACVYWFILRGTG